MVLDLFLDSIIFPMQGVPAASPDWTHGREDKPKSLREPRAKFQPRQPKLSNEDFSKNEFTSLSNIYCAFSGADML